AGRLMIAQLFDGVIFVAIVEHWPVIARNEDQRVVEFAAGLEGSDHFADAPVKFYHRIAPRSVRSLSDELFVRRTRDMNLMSRVEQEERTVVLVGNELLGLSRKHLGHRFVGP